MRLYARNDIFKYIKKDLLRFTRSLELQILSLTSMKYLIPKVNHPNMKNIFFNSCPMIFKLQYPNAEESAYARKAP